MEKEKNIGKEKRRRWEKEETGKEAAAAAGEASGRNKRNRGRRAEEEAKDEVDQVEEFFAIVQRMQAAVKYFDRGNINGHGWRAAVESVAGDEKGRDRDLAAAKEEEEEEELEEDEEEEQEERGGFDLNVVPPVKG